MADVIQIAHAGESAGVGGPLVTYHIQCYRHAAFAAAAVRSVLAQTYSPLEVLISDDGSPDGTFEIVRAAALEYRGPHRVVLLGGERNYDILAHWNRVAPSIRGNLFLSMAGDDLAEPNQVEELVRAWSGEAVSCVWSNYRVIDADGRITGSGLPAQHPYTIGRSDYADGRFLDFPYGGLGLYTRAVLDRFGPVPAHLGARGLEHHIGFRAALLGPKRYLDKQLMRRRDHPNRATAGHNIRDRQVDPMLVHERQIRVRLQVLTGCRDILTAEDGELSEALAGQIANEVRRLLEFEAYREKRRRLVEDGGSPLPHSGWEFPPNGLALVRSLPEYQCNMIAGECKYFAAPWSVGVVEPCGVRNARYAGMVSAWSEQELMELMSARSGS